ncbi:hypothetical protein [Nonomuraea solani]|uniref:hypothetical protein n=1 Tax=Nonomuraea solani TaxID=1144553 RepID=UPI0011AFE97A|nr:hypothetical protein [Nonomuraea solani]
MSEFTINCTRVGAVFSWDYWERHGRAMEHAQYRLRVPVTDEPAQVQADRILTALKTDDPRASAEKHGGHTTEVACDS